MKYQHLWKDPKTVAGGITLSYLVFYTAYDKASKKLSWNLLQDFFLGRRSWNWTLSEANKAISLSGLTTFLVSMLPEFKDSSKSLMWIAINMLCGHTLYSSFKTYNLNPLTILKEPPMKQLSIICGTSSFACMTLAAMDKFNAQVLTTVAAFLGMAHFYTMEIDSNARLQIRPFAYLPFPLFAWSSIRFAQEWIFGKK